MNITKYIAMAILLCLFFSEAGWILNQKFSKTKISSISVGFMVVLAVFQVIALLFMRFDAICAGRRSMMRFSTFARRCKRSGIT